MNENFQANDNSNNGKSFGNTPSITTSMISLWDSITGSQLKVSILNNGLGVAIWLPFINPDGSRKYPTEYRNNVVLTQKNAMVIEKAINDIIIPAYEKGTNVRAGVFTNSAKSSMLEIEVNNGEFYLTIYKNCDPVTRIPKDSAKFKFESASSIENFDSVSGEMEVAPIQADFFIFAKTVIAYNTLVAGTIAEHGSAAASAYMNRRIMEYIRSIAEAVHAQLPAPRYNNYGYNQSNNGIAQTNANISNPANNALPQVTTTEVTTLSDLIG